MRSRLERLSVLVCSLAAVVLARPLSAQVATDGTVGPRLELVGPDYAIGAGLGSRAGNNLFHSFERFSLGTGESAIFSGPGDVRNVISRVTGGIRSDVDGTLRSTIPGADFFFVNPAGVMFGPNASLDVQGSFHVSTADELRFADGSVFSATNPDASSLTVAAPEAFGFLGASPAAIKLEGSSLEVPGGEALSLIGGDLTLDPFSTLRAGGGELNLVSVGGENRVRVENGTTSSAPSGEIFVAPFSSMSTSGRGGGTVRIRGGSFVLDLSEVLADNIGDSEPTGGIFLEAGLILLNNASRVSASNQTSAPASAADRVVLLGGLLIIANDSLVQALTVDADGGGVRVSVDDLVLQNGGRIVVLSSGIGEAGDISVFAEGQVIVAGRGVRGDRGGMFSNTQSAELDGGDAGRIMVHAGRLVVDDNGNLGSNTFGGGAGGKISIEAGELVLTNGGTVSATTFASGPAGSVQVVVAGPVTIAGAGTGLDSNNSGLFTNSQPVAADDEAAGPAGRIDLTAGPLSVDEGGVIASKTTGHGPGGEIRIEVDDLHLRSGGNIQAVTTGPGDGGEIHVNVHDDVLISGRDAAGVASGFLASSLTQDQEGGDGGRLFVRADRMTIAQNGLIESRTFGGGSGGDVQIRVADLNLENGGQITVSTSGDGQAGRMLVIADELTTIAGRGTLGFESRFANNAGLFASSEGFTGNGRGAAGRIELRTSELVVDGGGLIATTTDGAGTGGTVLVKADRIELRDGAAITSQSTGTGSAGSLVIRAEESLLLRRGVISTAADEAGGGRITLKVGRILDVEDSSIASTVAGGAETTAGNITIDPRFIVLDESDILAQADQGTGGSIAIQAENILRSPGSRIDASSRLGIDGTVVVSSPEVDLTGGLVELEVPLLDAASLLRGRCAARRDIGASSFTGVGRGGLPPGPDQPLMSDYRIGSARPGDNAGSGGIEQAPAVLALACGGGAL